ncbi:hypothetical protein CSKR_103143 [Clonorchis sinensis]|uniref:Tubulin epsilon and delta complex protein 1 domain-containing protein n=2 Tax=Clonorchis sinensis TaxID=79923 RepID=G7YR57_CLOSI|nr:hypothetical protein CSKR_103143 [Clonorchis sinensis]GAA55437.1 hypothetical protein CLF_107948 [Clonorchis sinensis]
MPSTPVNVRKSIILFAKLLKKCGFSEYLPENFRLAKFDDPRSKDCMLRLLYEVVYFSQYGHIDDVAHEGFKRFSPSDVLTYAYKRLQKLGYPCLSTPNKLGSSRELLLAAAWVFSQCNIMSQIERQLLGSFDATELRSIMIPHFEKFTSHLSLWQLDWLLGRGRFLQKQLYQQRMGIIKSYLHSRGKSHLSPLQCLPVENPDLLQAEAERIKVKRNYIELLKLWQAESMIFWRWIQSVAKERTSDHFVPTVSPSKLSLERSSLLQCLSAHINLAKAAGVPQEPDLPFGTDQQPFPSLLTQIDDNLKVCNLQLLNAESLCPSFISPLLFHYDIQTSDKNSKIASRPGCRSLSEENAKLTSLLQTYRRQFEDIKNELSEQLQEFARHNMPDVLFLFSMASCTE